MFSILVVEDNADMRELFCTVLTDGGYRAIPAADGQEALETMLDLRKADEAFPSILGCQVAVAAKKCGKPVRCIFDRREDLEFTSKRHPSLCTYKVAAPQA